MPGPEDDAELLPRSVFTLAEGAGRLLLEHPERWSVQGMADLARASLAALRRAP